MPLVIDLRSREINRTSRVRVRVNEVLINRFESLCEEVRVERFALAASDSQCFCRLLLSTEIVFFVDELVCRRVETRLTRVVECLRHGLQWLPNASLQVRRRVVCYIAKQLWCVSKHLTKRPKERILIF